MIWKIFLRDINRIIHNFAAVIIVLGMCMLPALYAWFNVAANIDPYRYTSNIKIAVANNDTGISSEKTGSMNLGSEIVSNLKKNHQLGWNFVSEKTARDGVSSGKYFAAIVIPSGFSSDTVSVLSGHIKRPEIKYYLNEKRNAVAPKVTDSGASAVQNEVNESFVSVASETITNSLNRLSSRVTSDVENTQSDISRDLNQISTILSDYDDLVDQFSASQKKEKAVIKSTDRLLDQINTASASGSRTLRQSDKTLSDVKKSTSAYASSLGGTLSDTQTSLNQLYNDVSSSAGRMAAPVSSLNGQLSSMISNAQSVVSSNASLISDLRTINAQIPGAPASDAISRLEAENKRHRQLLSSLQTAGKSAQNAVNQTSAFSSSLDKTLDSRMSRIQKLQKQYMTTQVPAMNEILRNYSVLSGNMQTILNGIPSETRQVRTALTDLNNGMQQTYDSLSDMKDAIHRLNHRLDNVRTDLSAIVSSQTYRQFTSMTKLDPDTMSDFMASPIQLKQETFYPVANYGSAMTPFYTNLAIWIGGMVLGAIMKMEVDADEKLQNFNATQAYFGRWMLFIVLGLIQAVITCVGDFIIPGVKILHPGIFVLTGVILSFVYVNIVYALTLAFNHIGRALCVVLIILQIPGSSGTYPIEMTPHFFQNLHPLLPFTYGIDAMRECVTGYYRFNYVQDLLFLLVFTLLALFIGLIIRPLIMNLNDMVDNRLSRTGFMLAERGVGAEKRDNLSHIMKILSESRESRDIIMKRAVRFERRYPKIIRSGFLLIIIIPMFFLIMAFSINAKMIFLMLWILSIVLISIWLIVIEYIHEHLQERMEMDNLTDRELLQRVQKNQRHSESPMRSVLPFIRRNRLAKFEGDTDHSDTDTSAPPSGPKSTGSTSPSEKMDKKQTGSTDSHSNGKED